MTYPEQPLTLVEAIDLARAHGLTVDVMAGFASRTHELLVSLETIDPDPSLSLRVDRTNSAELLSNRDQSGPERWDYPHTSTEYQDRIFLRIVGEGTTIDLPLLPAVLGIVERYGLDEDLALAAPGRVDRKEFERAITLLMPAEQGQ